jgi:hypothetical protein
LDRLKRFPFGYNSEFRKYGCFLTLANTEHIAPRKKLVEESFQTGPPGITSGSKEDIVIRSEEGWILGCPR